MFFFFPVGSDAPLYYRPIATIALIVLNIVFFVPQLNGELEGWQLVLGDGVHPVQWWTSAFYHYGFMHLVGNMIFLWTFGLIVEGKLGWYRFLPLYFVLAGIDGAVTQVLMLAAEESSHAAGASGVITALMAIALIWAPKNEIDVAFLVVLGIWIRSGVFQVTVLMFSMFYIGLDFLLAGLRGFQMSSEVLHVLGAAIGFPVGCLLLKLELVDCEGWDAFSLWRGRTLIEEIAGPKVLRANHSHADLDSLPAQPRKVPVDQRIEQLKAALAGRNPLGAWGSYKDLRDRDRHRSIDDATMRKLIDALRVGKDWGSLIIVLEDYIDRFPESADRARLVLADILIRREQRPRAALRALEPVSLERLPEQERRFARKLKRLAESQIEDGVMELSVPS
jgi:membrane associated rhomboid family serine protease